MIDRDNSWHLDKRVPIALILAIVLQSGTAIWWASSVEERVNANTAQIDANQERDDAARQRSSDQDVQLGRIEEQVSRLREDVNRLVRILERRFE